jgi:hypothetical protein
MMLIIPGSAGKDLRVVPPICQLPSVPFPHEALPAAAELGLVEGADVEPFLEIKVVRKQRPEGG